MSAEAREELDAGAHFLRALGLVLQVEGAHIVEHPLRIGPRSPLHVHWVREAPFPDQLDRAHELEGLILDFKCTNEAVRSGGCSAVEGTALVTLSERSGGRGPGRRFYALVVHVIGPDAPARTLFLPLDAKAAT